MQCRSTVLALLLLAVCHGYPFYRSLPPKSTSYPSTCSHLVNGKLTCCHNDADCAGCDSDFCACWACGDDGIDVIDGRSYSCNTCDVPAPKNHSYPDICQHLVDGDLKCCKTNADCGDAGGECWACPDGSSWVDHKYFKCDTCKAPSPSPTPTPPPPPPTPPPTPTPPSPPHIRPTCCFSQWGDNSTCGNYSGSGSQCSTDHSKHCTSDADCPSAPTPALYPNVCQHLVNGSFSCCGSDADCGDEGGMCWACPAGSSYIDGKKYQCDTCSRAPPSPPQTYPDICQHLIDGDLKCCKTNADCGDAGGECWACPDGSSWVDHKYFKCDTCKAPSPSPTPTPPPPPPAPPSGSCCNAACTACKSPDAWCSKSEANCEGPCKMHWCPAPTPPPTPPPTPTPKTCAWQTAVVKCSADSDCAKWANTNCPAGTVSSYCKLNKVCHFSGSSHIKHM